MKIGCENIRGNPFGVPSFFLLIPFASAMFTIFTRERAILSQRVKVGLLTVNIVNIGSVVGPRREEE